MAIKEYFSFNKIFQRPSGNFTREWKPTPRDRQFKVQSMLNSTFGFQNPMAGIGGASDVMTGNYNAGPALYSYKYLDNVYRTNLYAQRIIDAPAQDMTRKWREFEYEDVDKVTERNEAEIGYCIASKVKDAVRYANLYGGAALLIVLDRNEPYDVPLDYATIKQGELKKLQPVFLGELFASRGLELNPSDMSFGEPEFYNINNLGQVHRSRVIKFTGVPLSLYASITQQGFGDSKLTSCMDLLDAAKLTYTNIANLVVRANIDVIGLPDFNQLAAKDADKIFDSLTTQADVRNNLGIMAIDAEDKFQRHPLGGMAGLAEILMCYLQMLSSAVPMPLTKFLGTSVDGFGSGENEIVEYYDNIAAKQNDLQPQLKIIDEIMEQHLFGEYVGIRYDWLPLHEPKAGERAQMEAQTGQLIIDLVNSGIISPRIGGQRLKKEGNFDGITDEFIEEELSPDVLLPEEDAEFQELLKGSGNGEEAKNTTTD